MASDLSTLIQDGICSTLTGLLAKDATIKSIHKVIPQDFDNIQTLRIDSTFEFDKITSTWGFILPAYSSSYIFNCMLGDDSEPSLELDDDMADAIGELVSNTSGGLTTAINGSGYEDLTGAKFNIAANEIQEIGSIDNFDNIFKFTIDLDGKEVLIFIQFDNVILPFIEHIASSEPSEAPSEAGDETDLSETENLDIEAEEQNIMEEPKKEEEPPPPPKQEESKQEEIANDNDEQKEDKKEDKKEEAELTEEEKKEKKLKLIIIGVGGLLALVIISAVVMYFLGWFDPPPPPPKVDSNVTKKLKDKNGIEVVQYKKRKNNDFDPALLNKKRLNARLALLTKENVLDIEDMQTQNKRKLELEKLKQKEKELIEFAKQNKEEDIFTKNDPIKTATTIIEKTKTPTVATKKNDSSKNLKKENNLSNKIDTNNMKFIATSVLKYKIYKTLLFQSKALNARISICKNNTSDTVILLGPIKYDDTRDIIFNTIKNNYDPKATILTITKKEFDKRCDF